MNWFSGAVTLCEVVGAEAAKLLSSKLMRTAFHSAIAFLRCARIKPAE